MRIALAIGALVGALALPVVSASGTPQDDFNATYDDWKPDGDVTACRFTQQQLENAYEVATGNPDFQYETAFNDELQREIDRWKSGGCTGVTPVAQRRVSPL